MNAGQSGFYRVNYEAENWHKLIHQLNTNHQVMNKTCWNDLSPIWHVLDEILFFFKFNASRLPIEKKPLIFNSTFIESLFVLFLILKGSHYTDYKPTA